MEGTEMRLAAKAVQAAAVKLKLVFFFMFLLLAPHGALIASQR